MIKIEKSLHQEMLVQLEKNLPLEGCGLMAGLDSRVSRIYPISNRLASPYNYEMEPTQQLEAIMDLEERGLELLAIYHSHPNGPNMPSASDVSQAYYPDSFYIIVSFRSIKKPSVRAFRIRDGMVSEVPYSIE